ncbi:hypothetical protein GOP47_0013964 [Adiantum capillus-veneris]|uniref:Nodulin-like domain-containing protein n=1 Tax=Adiantum capillus-veneris TaxID=13818 RepID=A0A9D4UPJ1_ADICA|nr:hypothetical protein GOP47_0013964 [Adiantum capillus-veneris]
MAGSSTSLPSPPSSSSWLRRLWYSRWLVLVSASWVETCTGLNVMYATFSPAIKSSLSYNQNQISRLGVAKDFGNAAEIIAGCLSQVLSTRGLLFLGGFQFLIGYGLLWLIVVNTIPAPPFWTVFILIFIGANAQKYLDMAAVVSALPSFPDSRGSLLGVLKAFKGLSGAIFSHIYSTFFSPHRSAALLIVAIGPALVAFITSPIVRPVGRTHREDKRMENRMYATLYTICFLIAGYMVFLLFFQSNLPAGDLSSILMILGLLVLIASPLVPTLVLAIVEAREAGTILEGPLNEALIHSESGQPRILLGGLEDDSVEWQKEEKPPTLATTELPVTRGQAFQIGEEVTLSQALQTLEFWLLFFALYCGLGSGSTALDNLGQMAQAQGYENTQTFVSIFSISSYLGHLVGGHLSEVVTRSGIPRPTTLIIVEGIMLLAQFLFAMAWKGSLYFATICLGLSYGSFSSINPAISSELFGLKSFGPIFGLLTLSAPASSTILAGFVAGALYDREAEKQQSSECTGQVCFYLTCWIMVGVCAFGMLLSSALSWRVRDLYKRKAEAMRMEHSVETWS